MISSDLCHKFALVSSILGFLCYSLVLSTNNDEQEENFTVVEPEFKYDEIVFKLNNSSENYSFVNDSAFEISNITQAMLINDSDIVISTELDSSMSFADDPESWENEIYKKIPRFVTPDEDICSCDLLVNICDINCCCDQDCTEQDMTTFSECYSQNLTPDKNYCYQKDLILRNNTPYKMEKDPESSLFCIVHDNFKEHLRFKDMPIIESHRDLKLILKNQKENKFSWDKEALKDEPYAVEWRHGSLIYISSPAVNHQSWSFPSSCFSEICACNQRIYYLQDFTSSCSIIVNNLEDECEKNPSLSADEYTDFCIKSDTTSSVSRSNLADLIVHTQVTNSSDDLNNEYSSNNLCAKRSLRRPTKNNSMCNNVVNKIEFVVETDSVAGVTKLETKFYYIDLTNDKRMFTQHFSVNFKWFNTSDVSKRSGNPGYQVGMPILAGTNSSSSGSDEPHFITVNLEGLSVLNKDSIGACSETRNIIKFGINLKSSCFYKIRSRNCKITQESILNSLLGPSGKQLFVGIFGNANVSNPEDWIEVYHDPEEKITDSEDTCFSSLELKIEIVYAAVGTVANPQFKILGVGYHYQKSKPIDLSCFPNCFDIIVSSSVSFFDITRPAVPQYAKIPSIKADLPKDFFYPFLYGKGTTCNYYRILIFVLVFIQYFLVLK
ncbi:tectonic-3-like [Uloborus diversus]|uniref:tectonic-3-like n=1 Tax=Uloborus diversus TaxID=327109 RepID=UPI002409756D|nr:tectonic-3-like [Uloborus diversus]